MKYPCKHGEPTFCHDCCGKEVEFDCFMAVIILGTLGSLIGFLLHTVK